MVTQMQMSGEEWLQFTGYHVTNALYRAKSKEDKQDWLMARHTLDSLKSLFDKIEARNEAPMDSRITCSDWVRSPSAVSSQDL
jgi:hypothetical protein